MGFQTYQSQQNVPSEYHVWSGVHTLENIGLLARSKAEVIIFHGTNEGEGFHGVIDFKEGSNDSFCLINPDSPEPEREVLTFRLEGLEKIFLKN